jgi:two-component system, NarL family, response regulator LiaR
MEETIFAELPKLLDCSTNVQDVIRVILIESREAMREGIRQMLGDDECIKVIAESRDVTGAIPQIQKLYPDIVILGGDYAGIESLKMIRQIARSTNGISVVMLSDEHALLEKAVEQGAIAFLTRDIERNELISAIRIVYLWRSILFQNDENFTLVKFS